MAENFDSIDQRLVRALAHPTRSRVLQILNEQEMTAAGLADRLGVSLDVIAYHLDVLWDCDCLDILKSKPIGSSIERMYRAKPRSYIGDQGWRDVPDSLRSSVTAMALQSFMNRATEALDAGTIDRRRDTRLTWFTIAVDEQGELTLGQIISAAIEQIKMLDNQCRWRSAVTEARLIPMVVGMAGFEPAPREGVQ